MSTIGFSRFLSVPTPVCGPQDLRLVPKTSDPEGLVGAIGAGMEDTALLTTLVRETDVEVLMLPGRYTLLDQSALDGLLPACQERGVSVIAPGSVPLRRTSPEPAGSRSDVWLPHRAVGGPGSSMRSAEEVRQNVNSFATPVAAQLWSDLCAEGLLDERVPIPSNRPTPTIRGRQGGRSSHRGHDQPARYDELGDLLLVGPPGAR
jgi:hypothetical protein